MRCKETKTASRAAISATVSQTARGLAGAKCADVGDHGQADAGVRHTVHDDKAVKAPSHAAVETTRGAARCGAHRHAVARYQDCGYGLARVGSHFLTGRNDGESLAALDPSLRPERNAATRTYAHRVSVHNGP